MIVKTIFFCYYIIMIKGITKYYQVYMYTNDIFNEYDVKI